MSGCQICEGEMVPWLRQPLDPKKNEPSGLETFSYCKACDLGSASPLPPPSAISNFYDLDCYYTQGESHIKSVQRLFRDKILTKLAYWADKGRPVSAVDFMDRLPHSAAALDIGSGGGSLLEDYARLGWTAVGIEPDGSAMSRKPDRVISVFQGTAEAIPEDVKGRLFDLVSMNHVLEHCLDPVRALENARTLLKEDGIFWCEVPNCGCYHFETFNICSEMFDAPRHLHFFTTASLRKMLEKAGFEVTNTYYHGYTRHHTQDWRAWERKIFENTKRLDPGGNPPEHSFLKSVVLLAKSFLAPPSKKYDCVGVFARRSKVK